jgi:hypothetical protein
VVIDGGDGRLERFFAPKSNHPRARNSQEVLVSVFG